MRALDGNGTSFPVITVGLRTLAVAPLLLALLAHQEAEQEDDSATRSVQDGVYSAAQAKRGARVYEKECLECHQTEQFVGPAYMDGWTGQTAYGLFELTRTTMPVENPSRLRRRAYADVLAYIFSLNGFPVGETEMKNDAQSLEKILIEGPYGPDSMNSPRREP
jgi:quinoprotein glucose dehydrogenase